MSCERSVVKLERNTIGLQRTTCHITLGLAESRKYRNLEKTGLAYAETCAQAFGQRFMSTLPRELRDMVYEYLVLTSVDDLYCVIVPYEHLSSLTTTRSKYGPCSISSGKSPKAVPYFLDQHWFGEELTYDAAVTIYQLVTIHVTHQRDLGSFLALDVFHTKVVPRQHIKRLDITLTMEAGDEQDFDYEIGRMKEQDNNHLVKAARWLDPLLGLLEPVNVQIGVWINIASKGAAVRLEGLLTPLLTEDDGSGGANCASCTTSPASTGHVPNTNSSSLALQLSHQVDDDAAGRYRSHHSSGQNEHTVGSGCIMLAHGIKKWIIMHSSFRDSDKGSCVLSAKIASAQLHPYVYHVSKLPSTAYRNP